MVEVVFAIKVADRLDAASQSDSCSYGWDQSGILEFGLAPRKRQIEICQARVGLVRGIG